MDWMGDLFVLGDDCCVEEFEFVGGFEVEWLRLVVV